MSNLSWIAAEYHFPSTYSIRVPGSSMTNVKVMPAPGPGTVRLAMIRVGIELFGITKTREVLFPYICSSELRVYPPERVSISPHLIKVYKPASDKDGHIRYQEGLAVREFAHAEGNMTVFMKVSMKHIDALKTILENIGYWGQASSLAYCINICSQEPNEAFSGMPIEQVKNVEGSYFSCFVSEFTNKELKWAEVVSGSSDETQSSLEYLLYIWPLVIYERRNGHTLLLRRSQGC